MYRRRILPSRAKCTLRGRASSLWRFLAPLSFFLEWLRALTDKNFPGGAAAAVQKRAPDLFGERTVFFKKTKNAQTHRFLPPARFRRLERLYVQQLLHSLFLKGILLRLNFLQLLLLDGLQREAQSEGRFSRIKRRRRAGGCGRGVKTNFVETLFQHSSDEDFENGLHFAAERRDASDAERMTRPSPSLEFLSGAAHESKSKSKSDSVCAA